MSSHVDHAGPVLERVYVWEWPVRLSHWLIAGSIVVLAVTGIYIGNPFLPVRGEATQHFVMGTIKSIHFWAAMVFLVSVLGRVLWMFAGNPYARWHQFLPVARHRLAGILKTAGFYTFLKRDPPRYVGHNPLAGLIYTAVFTLYALMILTGLALLSANAHVDSPLRAFSFLVPWLGGLQLARFLHHIGMWLILGFVAHHVWSAFLIAVTERAGLIESIFSGNKYVPPETAAQAREHIRSGR
jgi:Ni/Fe-hydrogenase 1 B-type cytochrome subunit